MEGAQMKEEDLFFHSDSYDSVPMTIRIHGGMEGHDAFRAHCKVKNGERQTAVSGKRLAVSRQL
jgi:hypothetical protein